MEQNGRQISEERLQVIENIRRATEEGDTFRKVELHDPVISEEDVKRVIIPFENVRRKPISRIKAFIARLMAERMTKAFNGDTEIVGLENALSVKGGAIMTANHYNPTDSTPPRLIACAMGKRKRFHIVVQQTNIFMEGFFGFLMKNCNTMPVSSSPEYMAKNLTPAIKKVLARGDLLLIYPEQEMWFNYKKPRPLREGAYQFAFEMGVPVIPCFIEMQEIDGIGAGGFKNLKHVVHVLPPIYPDKELSPRDGRRVMMERDMEARVACYESVYGIKYTDEFIPERDIAGYIKE